MTKDGTATFAVVDPRSFDGSPYQVAQRACNQAAGLILLAVQAIEDADVMCRNAELSRVMASDDTADTDQAVKDWQDSPQGRRLLEAQEGLREAAKNLHLVGKAAAFDPKSRL